MNKIAILIRVERMEGEVTKLRQAVEDGIYDTRSIVGDAVLILEDKLRELHEILDEQENPPT